MNDKINDYKKLLKERLTEKRYNHSLCVADEAVFLAQKYGGDKDKAYLAGLLHDITKNSSSKEHSKIFDDFSVKLSEIEKSSVKLWHAVSGAAYVKNILKIDDDEIINAIKYHTTAKADMTQLEKIIYLADFCSADRDYDDVDVMRKLAHEDMNKALVYALSYTINELIEKGVAIHNDTFEAYNYYVLRGINN